MEGHPMAHTAPLFAHDLDALIRAEYLEMPGLCLTIAQAARLWTADPDECSQTLDALTRAGFLWRSKDQYVRRGSGRWVL
jgi:hypothetical protein